MTDPQQHPKKPSQKQLSYLRSLAQGCGESFAYPSTSAQASAEIERLLGRKRSGRGERRREVADVRRAVAEGGGDAAAYRREDVRGYGSSATWR